MTSHWRIIDTGAMDPFSNMALDETLLKSYEENPSRPTFRIYGWSKPGLSFGYSQDPSDELDLDICKARSVPVVRRITGGGIILHGNEITYSLVCSKEDLGIRSQVEASYKVISSFLISFYAALGIDARFACDIPSEEKLGIPSTICFAAKEKYDIIVYDKKIGGSAQKRSRDTIFQHGSIPLNFGAGYASSFLRTRPSGKPENGATSLEEILGLELKISKLSQLLRTAFVRSFNIEVSDGSLSQGEKALFSRLKNGKYETAAWNFLRRDK